MLGKLPGMPPETTTAAIANAAPATTRLMPVQHRAASINAASFNDAERTVEVVWTTGANVRRYDYMSGQSYDESLVVEAAAIDMTRLNSGRAPVLNTHASYDLQAQIGCVERAWVDDQGQGRAILKLSGRAELAGLVQDIKDGIVSNISVGYSVQRYEVTAAANRTDGGTVPLYRAVAWQPAEISFVPVPADAQSGTRNQPSQPCEFIGQTAQILKEQSMPPVETPAVATPATVTPAVATPVAAATPVVDTRAADIVALCTRHNAPQLAEQLIRANHTVDQARAAILEHRAAVDAAAGGHLNTTVQTVRDEGQTRAAGIENAFLSRMTSAVALDDNGRRFRGMSLLEIGRDFVEARGVQTRGMEKMQLAAAILTRAGQLGTSDFPSILANVANKRLRMAYMENQGSYAIWARRAPNAPDFKSINVTQLSGAPDLLQTNEAGEFKYGTMTDSGETYKVITYGRIVSLTRQAIVNDDLRAFDRLIGAYGMAARRLENRLVYSQLTANAALADTGNLFNATAVTTAGGHANLGSGAGSALQLTSLTTARTAMRVQKGLQGEELNIVPSYLIVPAALEQTSYQLTSNQYVPLASANINEFRQGGRTALTPVVESVLDANSATAWYLASDSGQVDTVEYCYLDGAEGPVIESEMGFEVDGMSWRCRLDFAAKAIDFRGLYKSNGA